MYVKPPHNNENRKYERFPVFFRDTKVRPFSFSRKRNEAIHIEKVRERWEIYWRRWVQRGLFLPGEFKWSQTLVCIVVRKEWDDCTDIHWITKEEDVATLRRCLCYYSGRWKCGLTRCPLFIICGRIYFSGKASKFYWHRAHKPTRTSAN